MKRKNYQIEYKKVFCIYYASKHNLQIRLSNKKSIEYFQNLYLFTQKN